MISKYLSIKLKILSFLLIILVIYKHSYNLVINLNSGSLEIKEGFFSFLQNFIFNFIGRIPSSLFFIISGFLFFLNFGGSIQEFNSKFKKRVRTLFVPYLIWSLWGFVILYLLQLFPDFRGFFSKGLITDFPLNKILLLIFVNPIPYQLWFLRDLIVLVCLTPAIYIMIRYLRAYFILILFFLWISGINISVLGERSLLFFVTGAFLSTRIDRYRQMDFSRYSLVLTAIWLILALSKTILVFNQFQNQMILEFLEKAVILSGILSIWVLYDRLFKGIAINENKYFYIFNYTFFLFAFHEPVLTIFKKGLIAIFGTGDFPLFLIYIFAPLLTILLGIATGRMMERVTPVTYRIITGGRQNDKIKAGVLSGHLNPGSGYQPA